MLYHLASYGVPLPGLAQFGWMGVDLFFVLSGYLIGGQLLKPYTRGEQPVWGRFFVRRIFRVMPAYLLVLAVYFCVPAVRESDGIAPPWQFLTFTQNLHADYFHSRAFSHAWSLCIEEHFYLILPAVVWLLARKPGAGKTTAVMVATLLGGMLLRAWIWQHEVAPFRHIDSGEGSFLLRYVENIYIPTWTRLDGLLAGVALAVVKSFRPVWWELALARPYWFLIAGAVGVAAACSLETPGFVSAVFGFPMLSASLAALLAGFSGRTPLAQHRIPGATAVAAMAFSLYLSHKAVYHSMRAHVIPHLPDSALLAICAYNGAALAVGALLYLAVERPGMRLRERFF